MTEYNTELSSSDLVLYLKAADGFETNTKFGVSASHTHQFTGSVYVSGALHAYQYNTITHNDTIYLGSNFFGNDASDSHVFTGSLIVSGTSNFIGDTEFDANITTNGNVNVSGAMYVVGPISSSGHAEFGGDVVTTDDLKVSGNITAAGSTTTVGLYSTGPVSSSVHAEFGGDLTTTDSLNVSGGATILGALQVGTNEDTIHNITGTMFISGAVTLGAAGDANLTVAGSTTTVGLYSTGPISGSEHATFGGDVVMTDNLLVSGGIQAGFAGGMGPGASHNLTGSVYVSGTLQVGQALTALNGVTVSAGALNAQAVTAEGLLTAEAGVVITGGSLSSSVHAEFGEDVAMTDNLRVSGNITTAGSTTTVGLYSTGPISSSGHAEFGGDVVMTDNLKVSGNITTAGSTTTVGLYSTGPISSSGHAEFGGDVVMTDNLRVSGTAQFDGGIINLTFTSVSASQHGEFGGDLTTTDNLNVSGGATILGPLQVGTNEDTIHNITGTMYISGAVTLGAAGDANLTVAGSTTTVGLYSTGPISGSEHATFGGDVVMTDNLRISGAIQAGFAAGMGPGAEHGLTGSVYVSGTLQASQAITALNGITVSAGALNAQAVTAEGLLTAEAGVVITGGSLSSSVHAEFGGDVVMTDDLKVSGSVTVAGSTTTVGLYSTGPVSSSAHAEFGGDLVTTDNLKVSGAATILGGLQVGTDEDTLHRITGSLIASGSTIAAGDFMVASARVGDLLGAPNLNFEVHYDGAKSPTALANDKGGGDVVYFGTGSTTAGYLYYLNLDGGWDKVNANATGSRGTTGDGHASMLGIALGAAPGTNGMLVRGFFDAETAFFGSWLTGSTVYVHSGSDAGKFTVSAPSSSNSYVRAIGYCTNTPNVVYFNPDGTWVENS